VNCVDATLSVFCFIVLMRCRIFLQLWTALSYRCVLHRSPNLKRWQLPTLQCTVIGFALDWEFHKSLKHDRERLTELLELAFVQPRDVGAAISSTASTRIASTSNRAWTLSHLWTCWLAWLSKQAAYDLQGHITS